MNGLTGILKDVQKAMRSVTSADRAYALLRAEGLKYTRKEVREAWKTVGEKESWRTVVKTWGYDRPVPKAWRVEGPKGMTSKYQLVVEMKSYNPATDAFETRELSVRSNTLMTPNEALGELSDVATEYAELMGLEPISLEFSAFKVRPGE